MHAKVTKQFKMVPPGAVYPRLYTVGEVVDGRVAEVALAEKWAVEVEAPRESVKDQNPPPVVFKAKILKQCEWNGEKYAKGSIVEGDVAHALVDAKLAEALPDDPAPKK